MNNRLLRLLLCVGPIFVQPSPASPTTFEGTVKPFLVKNCQGCHGSKIATAGLNLEALTGTSLVEKDRARWEQIVSKISSGQMPPPGMPRPDATAARAATDWIDAEFSRQDKLSRPDPGRVVAHRLNRSEYSNTIRDLLGVAFHADEEFPIDDSGYGFDNIATVLTVSPTLMQKYMQAAEQIASRAVGGDPLPKPGMFVKRSQLRRFNTSTVEFRDRTDFDADYILRVRLVGHRGDNDPPVTVMLSIDGKPVKTQTMSTQINAVNRQSGETHRTFVEVRAFLTQGDHTFRSEFVNDNGIKDIPQTDRLSNKKNIFPDTMEIAGPFPPAEQHPAQKEFLFATLFPALPA